MGSSRIETSSPATQSGPNRKRKRRTYVMIIAVIIAFSLILVTVVLPDLSNENHQILKEGDFLEYKATGFSNNTNFTSNINITISGADESGIQGYLETSTGYPISAGDIPDYGHNFQPYAGSPPNYGEVVGNERISTPFGTKCVRMLYSNNEDEIVIADVGLDSYLTYRRTVSSVSGAYHYTYELNATNNTEIANADTVMQNANIQVPNTPSSTAGIPTLFGGGGFEMGSVLVGQDQQFHYILKGYNMTMYVFNLTDFKYMETTGQFQCINSLSRLPADPGETNLTVDPGIYWFIAFCKMSNQTINYGGEKVNGYFIAYFG